MLNLRLSDLTLGQLEIFFAAVEHNSFTRAALALHMTQSAVSKSIARLEHTLDLPLFVRRYREIELTPEGARLCESWRRCVADLNRSYEAVRQSLLEKTRRLRIGATGTTDLSLYFWPLVNRFTQEHAQVRLEFDSDSINRLVEKLLDQRLDLIFIPDFMHYTVEENGMRWRWAARDSAQAVMPQGHPLAGEDLTLERLQDEKIAVLDENTPDNKRWLRELFQSYGYQLKIGRVFNSPESVARFYQRADGIMLSDRYFDYGPIQEALVKKPVAGVTNGIICVWDPQNCQAEVQAFLELLEHTQPPGR